MSISQLFTALDILLAPYDPAGDWPMMVRLEAQTIVSQIEALQGYRLHEQ